MILVSCILVKYSFVLKVSVPGRLRHHCMICPAIGAIMWAPFLTAKTDSVLIYICMYLWILHWDSYTHGWCLACMRQYIPLRKNGTNIVFAVYMYSLTLPSFSAQIFW